MSEFTIKTEFKAMGLLFHPRINHLAMIRWRGFQDGVPPKVKLWDIPPVDATECACNAATVQENLEFFAEHIKANKEQIEASKKSFDSPSGISLIHRGPGSGRTTLAVLQALTAVSLRLAVEARSLGTKLAPADLGGSTKVAVECMTRWKEAMSILAIG